MGERNDGAHDADLGQRRARRQRKRPIELQHIGTDICQHGKRSGSGAEVDGDPDPEAPECADRPDHSRLAAQQWGPAGLEHEAMRVDPMCVEVGRHRSDVLRRSELCA